MTVTMSRRAAALVAALTIAASFAVAISGQPSAGKAASGASQIDVGLAAGRIEVLRPRGFVGGQDQPVGQRVRTAVGALISAALQQNGIQYHGGPVVMGENVVAIYWASSPIFSGGPPAGTIGAGSEDNSLIGFFLRNLGGTSYYNINTTYTDGSGTPVPNSLTYTGFWANNTNVPSDCLPVVTDSQVQSMILSGFQTGKIQYNANTVYTVFSAGKVNLGGNFGNCSGTPFQYCAYHGKFTSIYGTVLYAAMPYNAAYDGTGCTAFAAGGPPNGDRGADAEVNTLAHELEEANTDPRLNAWWTTADGSENADKCAWTFGGVNLAGTTGVPNTANIPVGSKNFLVQQNWINLNGGSCQKTYAGAGPSLPGAPTLNIPTPGNAQVSLTWTAPTTGGGSVDGYYVYRDGTRVNSTLIGGTSYTVTGLTNNVSYSFTVSAHNAAGEGGQSNARSATPTAGSGTLNGNVKNTATSTGLSGATVSLNTGQTTTTDASGNYSFSLAPASYSVTASKLNFGAAASQNGTVSAGGTTTLNFSLTPVAATTGTLNGRVTIAGTSTGIGTANVAISGPSSTSLFTDGNGNYSFTNLPAGSYSITVTKSGYSNGSASGVSVSGGGTTTRDFALTATGGVPAAPNLNAATSPRSCFFIFCRGGGVNLSWNVPVSSGGTITGYRVYRSSTPTVLTGGSAYATVTTTTYADTATTSGITYYYKVVAVNAIGPSPDSNVASASAG